MKRTKTIALSVATALGIGITGASLAGTDQGYSAASVQALGTSVAAMETHFGAQPGSISYFEQFNGDPRSVSRTDFEPAVPASADARSELDPAAGSHADSTLSMTVAEPTLVFSDGEWYSFSAGDWYALEGGEWHAMHGDAGAVAGSSIDDVSWYYVAAIPVEMVFYSADGTEHYIVEGDDVFVFAPIDVSGDASGRIASAEGPDGMYVYF
jgi:hypothetical protein